MTVELELLPPGCIAVWNGRREHDHACTGQMWTLADLASDCKAVHVRHHRIKQHEWHRLARGGASFKLIQSRRAIVEQDRPHVPAAEHFFEDEPIGCVVIDDEYGQVFEMLHARRDPR